MILKTFFKIYLVVFSLGYGIHVNAECLTDIMSAGLSFNSASYVATQVNGDKLTFSTSGSVGLNASWIIFCPDKKIEYRPYLNIKQYSFEDTKKDIIFSDVEETKTFASMGLEVRKPYKILGVMFEIPFIVELGQEMGFVVDYSTLKIQTQNYINLTAVSGLRYNVWRQGKMDINLATKLGLLAGLSDKTSFGILYGLSAEYYQKLGKKLSLDAKIYFDHYSQDYNELKMARSQLGLATHLIFRF